MDNMDKGARRFRGPVWVCSECEEALPSEEAAALHEAAHDEEIEVAGRVHEATRLLTRYIHGLGGLGGRGMPEETLQKLRELLKG